MQVLLFYWFFLEFIQNINEPNRILASIYDCNEIGIFERDIELSSCHLQRQIDDSLKSLSHVEITDFQYRWVFSPFYKAAPIGYLYLTVTKGKQIYDNVECDTNVRMEGRKGAIDRVRLAVMCTTDSWGTNELTFHYPLDIVKEDSTKLPLIID